MKKIPYIFLGLSLLLSSCKFEFEKEIDFSSLSSEDKLVVQGVVQDGFPAYVLLTKSQDYFSPINAGDIDDIYVTDATVLVSNSSGQSVELETGIIAGLYLQLDERWLPSYGESYGLTIYYNGDTITSTTTIPNEYPMDSVWFELDEYAPSDSLGNFWFHYTDPDTLGNTIMFEHKRLAHTKETVFGPNPANDSIEPNSISVYQSSDDLFAKALWGFVRNDFEGLNGTSFDSFFQRGVVSSLLTDENDNLIYENGEEGYFKAGKVVEGHNKKVYPDTVLIRISQVDYNSYLFWRSFDYQVSSNGNPFAEPINLQSNVINAYGIWCGQAQTYYKAVAKVDTVYTEEYIPSLFEIF